ncbi:MAG: hypothetical protein ACYDAK_13340 [Candidatus Limnocylindrales bacterium]
MKAVKRTTDILVAAAKAAVRIGTEKDLVLATEVLADTKRAAKKIADEKKKITEPLNTALNAARALFAPFERQLSETEAVLKEAIVSYHDRMEAERVKDAEKIAARVEKGTMRVDTAIEKIEGLGDERTSVHVEGGSLKLNKVRKVRCSSISHLKENQMISLARNGYIVWDHVKVRKDALAGIQIPGVEVYEETQASIGV